MFFKTKKAKEPKGTEMVPKTFDFSTPVQDRDPLTAYPAMPYHFQLQDISGNPIDAEWIKERCESLRLETVDATSGNYLDCEIVNAMREAMAELAKQREGSGGTGGHISTIVANEAHEGETARDAMRSIESLLPKLKAAKLHKLAILAGKPARGTSRLSRS